MFLCVNFALKIDRSRLIMYQYDLQLDLAFMSKAFDATL